MKIDAVKEILKKRNLKATSNRLNLLMKMENKGSAMSYSNIQNDMQPIDRVTLYRTIEKLKEKGIIHIAYQSNNEIYYAICGMDCSIENHTHNHVHFKCLNCKTVTCEDLLNSLKISLPNYEIHNVAVSVDGLCEICR
ncbi:MAG: Fur family transcriptional regulator [Crocinitomicaceae bacterium]|nr:Fur family transcriptional regulator [Crocinitomicaceae bacterium]|tara:strand:- start:36 stop:449 length:414 start_codon:yes stop_codon:yes gene_type:complete